MAWPSTPARHTVIAAHMTRSGHQNCTVGIAGRDQALYMTTDGGESKYVVVTGRRSAHVYAALGCGVSLDPADIVNPIRKLLKRTRLFVGDIRSIDLEKKKVLVCHGGEQHAHDLQYDHLVIVLGSVADFLNLPGVQQRALTMKSLSDAIRVRSRLIEHLDEADFECCPALRESLLTVAVAGAGFAGVETAAAVNTSFVRP